MNRALFATVLAAVTLASSGAAAAGDREYRRLTSKEIRARVVGMAVTDDAHWSDHFHAGGALVSYDLGRLKRGTWKLDEDELCLTRTGKNATTDCFEIWASHDAVQYRRDGVVIADALLRPIPRGEKP